MEKEKNFLDNNIVKELTFVQLKAFKTETTDFDICVSGGRVLAKVGNLFLSEVS